MKLKKSLLYIFSLIGLTAFTCDDETRPDYKVSVDDTVTIELNYTAGTGYSWFWVNQNEVTHLDSVNVEYEYNNQFVGGSGTMKWQFKGKSKGYDTLTFVYKRPWEDTAIEEKLFVVKVK